MDDYSEYDYDDDQLMTITKGKIQLVLNYFNDLNVIIDKLKQSKHPNCKHMIRLCGKIPVLFNQLLGSGVYLDSDNEDDGYPESQYHIRGMEDVVPNINALYDVDLIQWGYGWYCYFCKIADILIGDRYYQIDDDSRYYNLYIHKLILDYYNKFSDKYSSQKLCEEMFDYIDQNNPEVIYIIIENRIKCMYMGSKGYVTRKNLIENSDLVLYYCTKDFPPECCEFLYNKVHYGDNYDKLVKCLNDLENINNLIEAL